MADMEKAIRILEGNYKNFVLRHNGELITVNELLELLKAQEPRLVTIDDFKGADEYGWFPAWCEEQTGAVYCECILADALKEKGIRYWTSRPDEKRRAETPWN